MNKQTVAEKLVMKAVQDCLSDNPDIVIYRRNVGAVTSDSVNSKSRFMRFGQPGMSDFWGIATIKCPKCGHIHRGVHIEIECKGSNGKLSERQIDWLDNVDARGGIAIVIQLKNPEDLFNLKRLQATILQTLTNNVSCACSHLEKKV